MCGIFGFVGNPERVRSIDLDLALAALRHRGPDDSGTFRDKGIQRDGRDVACALAHTRLAIIDVSPLSHQPMTTADGRFTIVYNGETYNFEEVRQELAAQGERFTSRGDTEVVLKAFARWGASGILRFDGMFAFGVWDAVERTLWLARDRLGIKPLYWRYGPEGFAFASEVRALLATGTADRQLSPEGVKSYLTFGSVSDPYTILEGVSSLLPGHCLSFKGGEVSQRAYWALPSGDAGTRRPGEDAEELHSLLRSVVRRQLVADVPLGVFLSGGIDSSAVVALAAETSPRPIHTFTVTFDEEPYNEAPFAAAVAQQFGCDHHQVHLSAERAQREFDLALGALDQPSADGINTYFVSQAAKEAGLTVALSGLGGDEVFAGYSNFRTFGKALALGKAGGLAPVRMLRSVVSVDAFNGVPNRAKKLASLLETKGDPCAVYRVMRGMFTPTQLGELLEVGCESNRGAWVASPEALETSASAGGLDAVNAYSTLELSNYLRNTLLRDTDAMSMAHGLEVRPPLLDHRLIELAARVPGARKIAGRTNKPLLTLGVGTLPEVAVNRSKMGFTLPLAVWFRGPLLHRMESLIFSASPRGLLRANGLDRLWKSFLRGERFVSHSRIGCLAALSAWCQRHRVSV